jgi:hypothetical protein
MSLESTFTSTSSFLLSSGAATLHHTEKHEREVSSLHQRERDGFHPEGTE